LRKKMDRETKRKGRILRMMMAVVLPGLVISGLGVHYVSQQKKARELSLREKYDTILVQIRDETEGQIESAVEKVFGEIPGSPVTTGNPDALHALLKTILLKNPVVKYPFLINRDNTYLFPFSKKTGPLKGKPEAVPGETFYRRYAKPGSRLYTLYKRGEDLEFRERRFSGAIGYYLRALETTGEKEVKLYIYHAAARCYYKLNRYPQAVGYLEDIINEFPPGLKADKAFYFRVLHQTARAYTRMDLRDKAVKLYLRLYDEILQYEYDDPGNKGTFDYFKNEALAYLNRNVGKSDGGERENENRDRLRFDRVRAREGLDELSELEIELRWKYFEVDPRGAAGIDPDKSGAFTFDKIREFYLPTDEKTLFYKEVIGLKLWSGMGAGDTGIRTAAGLPLKDRPGIAYAAVDNGDSGRAELLFGFMISFDFIRGRVLPLAERKFLGDGAREPLSVFIEDNDHPNTQREFPFRLNRLPFKRFLAGRHLVLAAGREDYIASTVETDMWLNYGLIVVIISMLMLGTWFFYKYISREAELVRLKSDFVDSASHTLKTPLTRIRMMAEKMELGWIKDEAKKKEYFRAILSETDRMAEMINNMLDFSKVESGKKHYEKKTGPIVEEVRAAVELLSAHVEGLGFQWEVELENDIPLFPFDPAALKLIVVNLVQNALKYSPGEKYIAVKLYKDENHAVIRVTDRGMGIPEKEREKIFKQFYRVPAEAVAAMEGSGLGLFLVRHAVTAHGGRITVESTPGKGSTFNVYLPFKNHENL